MAIALSVVVAAAFTAAVFLVADRRRPPSADQVARLAVDGTALAIVAGAGDRVTLWNAAAEDLFGWEAAEVVGRPLPTLGDDDARRRDHHEIVRRAQRGERIIVVAEWVRADGAALEVRLTYGALADPVVDGWVVTARDVSAEQAAARSATQRVLLADRLDEATAGLAADLDLDVVRSRAVRACSSLLGAPAAALIAFEPGVGRITAVDGLPPGLVGEVPGADWRRFGVPLADGNAVAVDYAALPHHARLDDEGGSLDGVGTVVLAPTCSKEGPAGLLAAFFDHDAHPLTDTEVRAFERLATHAGNALHNAKAHEATDVARSHLHAALDAVAEGVAVTDEGGVVTAWNRVAEHVTGLVPADVIGRRMPPSVASHDPKTTPLPGGGDVVVFRGG
jgi:PAS domain S-box-containing protein